MRFLLLLCLWPVLAQAQVPSNCQPSTQLLQVYERDIHQMALNYLYTTNHPDTGTVEIPSFWSQRVANGMMAILSSNLPEADSIFNYHCVHHGFIGLDDGFSVTLDTRYTWARNLYDEVLPTGNAYVDSLMMRHGLYVYDTYSSSFTPPTVSIGMDSMWNITQLVHAFQSLAGVDDAYEGGFIGDASRITYSETNGMQTYTFDRRWGFCPMGCSCSETWSFQVDTQCQVTYLGKTQSAPMPMCAQLDYIPQCNAFNSVDRLPNTGMALKVYPNPSDGLVYIDAKQEVIEEVSVFGLDGQLLHQVLPNTTQVQLTLSDHWPTGVYLIQARIKDRVYHEKLVLQR